MCILQHFEEYPDLHLGSEEGSTLGADLEKAASSASSACGHYVGNHALLRTFLVKSPVRLTEDG